MKKIGIIGLGKMGEAIAYRLKQSDFAVEGFDIDAQNCEHAKKNGIKVISNIESLIKNNEIIWIMVPVSAVDFVIKEIATHAAPNTIVVDGGNSYFADSQKRALTLKEKNISFLDCGTSGGIAGRRYGFCLMVGGEEKIFEKVESIFFALAMTGPLGYDYCGPSGAGHYVKMIHNGIEYGIMQAYAEGFHLLHEGEFKNKINLHRVACLWNHGSIIRSHLLKLVEKIFDEHENFDGISGVALESGMGKWTVQEGKKQQIPTPVIEASCKVREESQKTGGNFATKIVALLRNKFGGHQYYKKS